MPIPDDEVIDQIRELIEVHDDIQAGLISYKHLTGSIVEDFSHDLESDVLLMIQGLLEDSVSLHQPRVDARRPVPGSKEDEAMFAANPHQDWRIV